MASVVWVEIPSLEEPEAWKCTCDVQSLHKCTPPLLSSFGQQIAGFANFVDHMSAAPLVLTNKLILLCLSVV